MRVLFTLAISLLYFTGLLHGQHSLQTHFEKTQGKETPTYEEIIAWWKKADQYSPFLTLQTKGPTDAGFPLHLAIVSSKGFSSMSAARKAGATVILINNGIHPGEPDGIDASMLLVKKIIDKKITLPPNLTIAIIPIFNIGGCLNRSTNYRVDQEGPEAFGSRGNSQYLDLNRDLIKCDSKEALSFSAIYQECDPDVFIDNHVSNGADYQHVMTLLTSQPSKLGGVMEHFLRSEFEPALFSGMKEKGLDMVPYVNAYGEKPENGWSTYWDSPRYTSGYATLWHSFAFVPEAHMLKPYDQRVMATTALLETFLSFTGKNGETIKLLRKEAKQAAAKAERFPIKWELDKSGFTEYTFKGYESGTKPSNVSGLSRLFYDRSKPFTKSIKVVDKFVPTLVIEKPKAYVIPQGWWKVIERLLANNIQMTRFEKDTTLEFVEWYKIEDYKTSSRQFEMHHLNSDVVVSKQINKYLFRKGDWYIPMNQSANRFLIETLEPQAEDAYFVWNFFDAILGQKEGYSAYVFEDKAAQYLRENSALRTQLEQRRAADTNFAKSARAQLDFVYRNSPWVEPDHNRYPVFRVLQ
ncbi:MAG: hypothetical protein FJY19_06515 [Bacteroidetes bacterium]|nr:hypothetical protein [Bacteroidota bacterium]